jgi:enamine deaminase RidA (YjgF/YER057c/UK114 family)
MDYRSYAFADLNVQANLSCFRPRGGAEECFLSLVPVSYGTFSEQLSRVEAAYRRVVSLAGLHSSSLVFRRFFCSDLINQADELTASPLGRNLVEGFSSAVSFIEQPPLPLAKVSLLTYHVMAGRPLAHRSSDDEFVCISRNGYGHLFAAGLTATEHESSYDQTWAILTRVKAMLEARGLTMSKHLLRTWIYVQNVDADYAGLVRARREFFDREGMTAETHYVASTGIEGCYRDPAAKVTMDIYAVDGIEDEQISYLSALEHLSHTHAYGVTFERGTSVDYGDRRHVILSGTASIDSEGRIVHPGNVCRQLDRTLENMEALLHNAGAELSDLMHCVVYLRDHGDYEPVRAGLQERLGDVPMIMAVAPVCRPGWLVEVEGTALIDVSRPEFAAF